MRSLLFLRCALFVVFFLCSSTAVFAAGDGDSLLAIRYDTALFSVIVFVLMLLVLRAKAWGPILEGLQKREETIRTSLEEAKKARIEMEQMRLKFQQELAAAHQEIPKLMEEARKKGEEMTAEMLAKASAQIQQDRDRLRREMEIAKDQALKELWEQSAQLATLISAKAIGRALSQDDHHRLIDEAMQEMRQAGKN
jgi:F-type H+-transporting ATPase subunit b